MATMGSGSNNESLSKTRTRRDVAIVSSESRNCRHNVGQVWMVAPIVIVWNATYRRNGSSERLATKLIVHRDMTGSDGLFDVEVISSLTSS